MSSGLTDPGLKRNHNEDNILVCPDHMIFAVADGMGGHAAGEVASKAVVETLDEFIKHAGADPNFTWPFGRNDGNTYHENVLVTGIQLANNRICQMAEQDPSYSGMGTTAAVLYIPEDEAVIAHVGDSRVYRVREGKLELLTEDHSWVNEQLQRNIITEEEARNHRWRNVITRALGNRTEIEVDVVSEPLVDNDLYLLCSDGLTTMLEDDDIAELVQTHYPDLEQLCHALIDAANRAGGLDNISIILVQVHTGQANDEA